MREEYTQRADDEIDLVEMLVTLWRGKWIILLIMLVFAGLGIAYAKLSPKTWTSQAQIAPAKYTQISDFITLMERQDIITGESSGSPAAGLFAKLKQDLISRDNRIDYVKASELYQALLAEEGIEQDSLEAQILLERIVNENISVDFPSDDPEDKDEDKSPLFVTLQFTAPEPGEARAELANFLTYVSSVSFAEFKENLTTGLNNRITILEATQEVQKNRADISKGSTIEELKQALNISTAAGIDDAISMNDGDASRTLSYLITSNVIASDTADGRLNKSMGTLYPFMMGTKNLSSQVDVLENNPTLYPVEYHQRAYEIQELKALSAEFDALENEDMFYYISSPNYPVVSNGVGTKIIVLIALLLGMLIGMMIVLLNSALNNRQQNIE